MNRVPLQVAERARRRRREGGGVQEQEAAVLDERIDAGNQIGPPHVTRRAAARHVDDGRAPRRRVGEYAAGRVLVDDVRADDLHRHRQAAARVDDAADVPAAEQRVGQDAAVAAVLAPATVRHRVEHAQVERLADVEVVVAFLVLDSSSVRALFPAVFASFDPPDVPRLRPSLYWTLIARPLAERLFSDGIMALYSSWPPLVLKSTSVYGFCTRVT